MSVAAPKVGFQFPVGAIPCSITFAPNVNPAGLIRHEGLAGAPAERYELARRDVLNVLFRDMHLVCASAVIQCYTGHPLHENYVARAAESRSRVTHARE